MNYFFFLSAGVFNVDASHLEMTICPRHRDLFGSRSIWKVYLHYPDEIAAHKSSSAKELCGLRSAVGIYLLKNPAACSNGLTKSHGLKY